jgi:hypothetical protein
MYVPIYTFLANIYSFWLQNIFAREAAYNLSLIYVTTGTMPLVETLADYMNSRQCEFNYFANCSYLLYMLSVVCIRITCILVL